MDDWQPLCILPGLAMKQHRLNIQCIRRKINLPQHQHHHTTAGKTTWTDVPLLFCSLISYSLIYRKLIWKHLQTFPLRITCSPSDVSSATFSLPGVLNSKGVIQNHRLPCLFALCSNITNGPSLSLNTVSSPAPLLRLVTVSAAVSCHLATGQSNVYSTSASAV